MVPTSWGISSQIKRFGVVLLVLVALALGACGENGEAPFHYSNTRWVCEEYGIWFDVSEDSQCQGAIETEDGVTRIALHYVSNTVYIFKQEENEEGVLEDVGPLALWCGSGRYKPESMTLRNVRIEGYFDDEAVKLVFLREDMEEA